ncbi:MAG: proline dehydrogenase family protein [Melioribacteraceae bacterium]|nr:proline dehydrogenase family protein [Melioribacteraceae bacterium]
MSIFRESLLWASQNEWLKKNVPDQKFVRTALKKFMPGEELEDAIREALLFKQLSIPTVFTRLGENITNLYEGSAVKDHYLKSLDVIKNNDLDTELSIKLTQLGFDISEDDTKKNFREIVLKVNELLPASDLFIDMEGSDYTERTIKFYKDMKVEFNNIGICLQAYLHLTNGDIDDLLPLNPKIRLVKGAYRELPHIAFEDKALVDQNYYKLAQKLLSAVKEKGIRAIFATHDEELIYKIILAGKQIGLEREQIEFQMLYGIKPTLQKKLAAEGYTMRVLISYGAAWYPWYMRRLAERPANVMFVLKNIFE